MITIKEIAKLLGISTTTVSNVIHGKTTEVSPEMIKKVEAIIKEYDYIPNMNARNLATQSTKIIGVGIVGYREDKNYLKDVYISELIGAIELEIKKYGYMMMIYSDNSAEQLVKTVFSWNVDGLILFGLTEKDRDIIDMKYNKPKVYIDTYPIKNKDLLIVSNDDELGGYMMGKYLISRGHKKIAFIADNMHYVNMSRYKGLKRALDEYSIKLDLSDVFSIDLQDDMIDSRYFNLLDEALSMYTALFCASDFLAIFIMNYYRDKGISVPENISITGFDGNIYSALSRPRISTIKQSPDKKGKEAVKYLMEELLHGKKNSGHIKHEIKLLEGETVKYIGE